MKTQLKWLAECFVQSAPVTIYCQHVVGFCYTYNVCHLRQVFSRENATICRRALQLGLRAARVSEGL